MRLDWGSGQSIEVTTSQDLNAAFDAVSGGETGTEPVLAFLDGFKGTLTIGLGNLAGSVLMYRSRSTPPLVVHVVGDAPARVAQEDRPYLVFSASGRHYEFARGWV